VCGDPESELFMMPTIIKGETIATDDPYGIIIGRKMAEKLKVNVDDSLILFVATESGAQEAIMARVRGIYQGLLREQEELVIYIPIEASWELLLEKNVHRLLVFLHKDKDLAPMVKTIKTYITENKLDLEVKSWEELATYYKQIVGMIKSIINFGGAILFFVIIFGIINTIFMVIGDRTREIGTMRAFGRRKWEILQMFLTEGVLIGVLGAAIGIIFSFIAIPIINALHITLPPGPGQDDPIPVFLVLDYATMWTVVAVDVVTSLLASLLPAYRGASKKIADSLRQL